jgi:hypothetical protein
MRGDQFLKKNLNTKGFFNYFNFYNYLFNKHTHINNYIKFNKLLNLYINKFNKITHTYTNFLLLFKHNMYNTHTKYNLLNFKGVMKFYDEGGFKKIQKSLKIVKFIFSNKITPNLLDDFSTNSLTYSRNLNLSSYL